MSAEIRGIVVGYDGSPGADVALDWAIKAAERDVQPLTVLLCADLSAVPAPRYDIGLDMSAIDERTKGILHGAVGRAAQALGKDRVGGFMTVGSAAGELIWASRQADLVVTGSRGRGRLRTGLLGSTAYRVATQAECPVVIVRGELDEEAIQIGPEGKIVVGIDDSRAAERALDTAAQLAAVAQAPLEVVHVAVTAADDASVQADVVAPLPNAVEELREYAEKAVSRAVDRVRGAHLGVDVTGRVVHGVPGQVLADLGKDAALIVVGSRGRGGFIGMLLGSVSHSVIQLAQCPVMVVR